MQIVLRPVDKARATRAVLAIMRDDALALQAVLDEASEDKMRGSAAALVLALASLAATASNIASPDADAQLESAVVRFVIEDDKPAE